MKLHWEECTFFFSIRHNPVWKLSWWVWLNRVGPEVLWFIHGQFVQFFLPISNESLQFVVLYYRRKDKVEWCQGEGFIDIKAPSPSSHTRTHEKRGWRRAGGWRCWELGFSRVTSRWAGCRRHGYLPGGRHLHSADIGKSPQMAKSPQIEKTARTHVGFQKPPAQTSRVTVCLLKIKSG